MIEAAKKSLADLIVLAPGILSQRLQNIVDDISRTYKTKLVTTSDDIPSLQGERVLFAAELFDSGINIELFKMLEKIAKDPSCMENSVASIIVSSNNELFSRDIGRKIIFYANLAGCTFPGRPISEATGSLKNFKGRQRLKPNLSLIQCFAEDAREVVQRLMAFEHISLEKPRILVLHASNYTTSNTLSLWEMTKQHLPGYQIKEIHIENGSVVDCKGCPYKACKHYSRNDTCFYGGIMVEEVYPAIINCDILIMLCPNYNDAISANISAAINRLTALFRRVKFYDKYLFALAVSGFSGSDIVAQQLISSFNINKTFILPPRFVLMETANDMKEIDQIEDINKKAEKFAQNIIKRR